MKVLIAIIVLSITAFLAYWFLSEPKNETPELVFTSNFSIAEIKLPDFEMSEIAQPTVEIELQKTEITAVVEVEKAVFTATEKELVPEEETVIEQFNDETKPALDLNDDIEKQQYFDNLINGYLQKLSLRNSHPFFEKINDHAFYKVDAYNYVTYGFDEAYALELKKQITNHYQSNIKNLKTICGKEWCNAIATLPMNSTFDKTLCQSKGGSRTNCEEWITLEKNTAYHQAKHQHNLQCRETLTTEPPEYDEKGNTVNSERFLRKLKKKIDKCKNDSSGVDIKFERHLVLKIKRQDSLNMHLQPLLIEEVPLLDTEFGNLEEKMTRYMTHELLSFGVVLADSIDIQCENVDCKVRFVAHIPLDDRISLGSYFSFISGEKNCGGQMPGSWEVRDGYEIHTREMDCVLPENYELYL